MSALVIFSTAQKFHSDEDGAKLNQDADVLLNRFDDITRSAFSNLFEKVSTPEAPPAPAVQEKDIEIPF